MRNSPLGLANENLLFAIRTAHLAVRAGARAGIRVTVVIIVLVCHIGVLVSAQDFAGIGDMHLEIRLAVQGDADLVNNGRTPVVGLDIPDRFLRILKKVIQTVVNRARQGIDRDGIRQQRRGYQDSRSDYKRPTHGREAIGEGSRSQGGGGLLRTRSQETAVDWPRPHLG